MAVSHNAEFYQQRDRRWYAVCSCRTRSEFYLNRQAAEDWHFKHLELVEQVRVHLRSKRPSIKSQYDYYREMENDPNTLPEDRVLWRQLADELRTRLPVTNEEQGTLFDMTPVNRKQGVDKT